MNRIPFFLLLSVLLFLASVAFYWQCWAQLVHRDYVAATLLLVAGLSLLWAAGELARLSLAERDRPR